jgi:hypothetical protein
MVRIDESLTAKGFTPAGLVRQVFGRDRVIKSITIHHWGAFGQTHDGVNNFFVNGPGATSAHYNASAGRVNCLVNPLDAAWHSGNAEGNATSIGIECRPEATDGDYATVAELIRHLRDMFGPLPLVPHRDWQATACPGIWDLGRLDRLAKSTPAAETLKAPAPAPKEEEEMLIIASDSAVNDGKVWIGNGIIRRHIPNPGTLKAMQDMAGWGLLNIHKNGEVQNLPQDALGVEIGGK